METFFTILILTLIVPISGILSKIIYLIKMPLPLFQILLGALLAYPKFGLHVNFNPELFLVLFIPPLLFFDGLNTNLNDFFKNILEIILLALILVFITIIMSGVLIYFTIPNILLVESLMLSSVLSPTDAVSLISIIGDKIPKRIMTILQGEALMNDASGLVSLKCAIAVYTGFMIFNINNITIEFIKIFIGGILTGIIITWIYDKFLKFINYWNANDDIIQIILLFILPFISYLTAEHFRLSGILSSVSSGMSIKKFNIIKNYSYKTKIKSDNVWKTLEFILNGIVFIMLGLQLPVILNNVILDLENKNIVLNISKLFFEIIIIYFFIIFLRFIWILLLKKISIKYFNKDEFLFSNYNIYELLIISFAGVRGSITLAGVLSMPILINNNIFLLRNRFIFISAGVILLSLIVGTIILPIFINKNLFFKKRKIIKKNILCYKK